METNLDKLFKTDEDAEKNGKWVHITEDTCFLLRPFMPSNPRVRTAAAAYFKPHLRQIELGTLDREKENEIKYKLFIDVSLVDWKGVEFDGKEQPFSKENALTLFKRLPALFASLERYASEADNYKAELGNS